MAHDLMVLAGVVVVLAGANARAETLPDPTRPPAFLFVPTDGETVASESARAGLVLQSVLIGPDRRSAIIAGRHLAVGDRVGDFILVKIDATQVLLRGPDGSRTLDLFPGVDKRLAQAAAGARSNATRASRDTDPAVSSTEGTP